MQQILSVLSEEASKTLSILFEWWLLDYFLELDKEIVLKTTQRKVSPCTCCVCYFSAGFMIGFDRILSLKIKMVPNTFVSVWRSTHRCRYGLLTDSFGCYAFEIGWISRIRRNSKNKYYSCSQTYLHHSL